MTDETLHVVLTLVTGICPFIFLFCFWKHQEAQEIKAFQAKSKALDKRMEQSLAKLKEISGEWEQLVKTEPVKEKKTHLRLVK